MSNNIVVIDGLEVNLNVVAMNTRHVYKNIPGLDGLDKKLEIELKERGMDFRPVVNACIYCGHPDCGAYTRGESICC